LRDVHGEIFEKALPAALDGALGVCYRARATFSVGAL
jgi:hypothetical protein